jgi:hypothetical protein
MTVLISSIARFFPAQFAGPKEKGMNAERFILTSSVVPTHWRLESTVGGLRWSSGNHLSGQNVSGSGEKF